MRRLLPVTMVVALGGFSLAHAQSAPDWQAERGMHGIAPRSDNGHLTTDALGAEVGRGIGPTITREYLASPNLGIERLAALPFLHDGTAIGHRSR